MKTVPKNITRFDGTSFNGWRLTIRRRGETFRRFFSDKEHGGKEKSLVATVNIRDYILKALQADPDDPKKAFKPYFKKMNNSKTPPLIKVKVKRVNPVANVPTRAHEGDAGFDLYASSVSPAYKRAKNEEGKWDNVIFQFVVDFGIAVEIPQGYVGKIYARSSIYKTRLRLSNCVGIIDSGYRGELKAVFDVIENAPHTLGFPDWDKACAQLVIEKLPDVELIEADELSPSERGEGGFGSSDNITRVKGDKIERNCSTLYS